jgi:intracellular multiplication protein IcmD
MSYKLAKNVIFIFLGLVGLLATMVAFGDTPAGIGKVAGTAVTNLSDLAKLITAGSYVAGMAFGVAAVVKFKAHKDNPTQIHVSQPIALLFVSAALIFIPSVFSSTGGTLFGASGIQAGISGFSSF